MPNRSYDVSGRKFETGKIGYLFYEPDGEHARKCFLDILKQVGHKETPGLYIGRMDEDSAKKTFNDFSINDPSKDQKPLIAYRHLVSRTPQDEEHELLIDEDRKILQTIDTYLKREANSVALFEPTFLLNKISSKKFVENLSVVADRYENTNSVLLVSIDEEALEPNLRAILRSAYQFCPTGAEKVA